MALNPSEKPFYPKANKIELHEVDDVMHSLWVSFHVYLGLKCDDNPDPKIGYKFEREEQLRERYLGQAIRMRNKYAVLAYNFDRGKDLLEKMTIALSNSHKGACWWEERRRN